MFIIIPTRTSSAVRRLLLLMVVLFAGGAYVGMTTGAVFKSRELFQATDLIVLPVGALGVWVLYLLGRRLFQPGPCQEGLFSQSGFSAWVAFLFAFSSLGGGVWLGSAGAGDEIQSRMSRLPCQRTLVRARNNSVTPIPQPVAQSAVQPSKTAQSPTLHLQIIFYNSSSTAVIDGKTVGVGEKIGNWRVKAITPRTVQLQDANGVDSELLLK